MIFNKNQTKDYARLKNVLISDKQFSPKRIEKVLKSDLYCLLSNYCILSPENLELKLEVQQDGKYKFEFVAVSDRLKIFGSLPNDFA